MTTLSQNTSSHHHYSKRILIASSTLLIVLTALYITLAVRAHRAYEAYLRTPEGQVHILQSISVPVTETPADRAQDLMHLEKNLPPKNK